MIAAVDGSANGALVGDIDTVTDGDIDAVTDGDDEKVILISPTLQSLRISWVSCIVLGLTTWLLTKVLSSRPSYGGMGFSFQPYVFNTKNRAKGGLPCGYVNVI